MIYAKAGDYLLLEHDDHKTTLLVTTDGEVCHLPCPHCKKDKDIMPLHISKSEITEQPKHDYEISVITRDAAVNYIAHGWDRIMVNAFRNRKLLFHVTKAK